MNDSTGTLRWVVNDNWQPVDVAALCAALGVSSPDGKQKPAPAAEKPPKKPEVKVVDKQPETDGTAALQPVPAVLEKPKSQRVGKSTCRQDNPSCTMPSSVCSSL